MTVATQTPAMQLGAPLTPVTGTSAAASALTVTIAAPTTPAAGVAKQIVIPGIAVSCVGAASGAITLTVNDSSTPVFVVDLSLTAGTPLLVPLPGPIAITLGHGATIVTTAGAASCVIKINSGYTLL